MSSMTDDKLESNYKGNALLHLLSYMKPYAGWVMLCLVLVLALTGFDLYRPTLIGDAIDNFETQGDYNVIINTAWKYGIVLVVSFIFNMAQTWILQKTGQKIILTVRRELYIHIQSLSSRFFDLTPVGKLVTRVTNDVEALNEMYSGILKYRKDNRTGCCYDCARQRTGTCFICASAYCYGAYSCFSYYFQKNISTCTHKAYRYQYIFI